MAKFACINLFRMSIHLLKLLKLLASMCTKSRNRHSEDFQFVEEQYVANTTTYSKVLSIDHAFRIGTPITKVFNALWFR